VADRSGTAGGSRMRRWNGEAVRGAHAGGQATGYAPPMARWRLALAFVLLPVVAIVGFDIGRSLGVSGDLSTSGIALGVFWAAVLVPMVARVLYGGKGMLNAVIEWFLNRPRREES